MVFNLCLKYGVQSLSKIKNGVHYALVKQKPIFLKLKKSLVIFWRQTPDLSESTKGFDLGSAKAEVNSAK